MSNPAFALISIPTTVGQKRGPEMFSIVRISPTTTSQEAIQHGIDLALHTAAILPRLTGSEESMVRPDLISIRPIIDLYPLPPPLFTSPAT